MPRIKSPTKPTKHHLVRARHSTSNRGYQNTSYGRQSATMASTPARSADYIPGAAAPASCTSLSSKSTLAALHNARLHPSRAEQAPALSELTRTPRAMRAPRPRSGPGRAQTKRTATGSSRREIAAARRTKGRASRTFVLPSRCAPPPLLAPPADDTSLRKDGSAWVRPPCPSSLTAGRRWRRPGRHKIWVLSSRVWGRL
jgi:hypothetical protein